MSSSRKKFRGPVPGLPALPPEARAELEAQVARLSQALAAGQDLEALRLLVQTRPEDLAWDLELLAALGALGHAAIPSLLAALFGDSPHKERRKALKRTLHLLKTRGLAVPADLLPREEAVPLGPAAAAPGVAHLSPLLGSGERYVILEGPQELLGGNFLVARLSDREGFQECHLLTLKRKHLKEFWDLFRQQGLTEWVTAPPPYGVTLLEEAYRQNPGAEGGASRYATLKDRLHRHWGPLEEAPDERRLPALDPGERRSLLEQSRSLAQEPLFASWLPGLDEITPWLNKIQAAQDSPLVLTEQQQRERLAGLVEEAAAALFPPETRELWGRRLLAMAYFLELRGRQDLARAAQAAGEDLRTGTRSHLLGENPFLQSLVWQALQLALELLKTTQPQEGVPLVAKPASPLIVRR